MIENPFVTPMLHKTWLFVFFWIILNHSLYFSEHYLSLKLKIISCKTPSKALSRKKVVCAVFRSSLCFSASRQSFAPVINFSLTSPYWLGATYTISRRCWSTIRSAILRAWLISLTGWYAEQLAKSPFPLHFGTVMLVDQVWGSRRYLIWFVTLVSHINPAGSHIFQTSPEMSPAPITLSFFIYVSVLATSFK